MLDPRERDLHDSLAEARDFSVYQDDEDTSTLRVGAVMTMVLGLFSLLLYPFVFPALGLRTTRAALGTTEFIVLANACVTFVAGYWVMRAAFNRDKGFWQVIDTQIGWFATAAVGVLAASYACICLYASSLRPNAHSVGVLLLLWWAFFLFAGRRGWRLARISWVFLLQRPLYILYSLLGVCCFVGCFFLMPLPSFLSWSWGSSFNWFYAAWIVAMYWLGASLAVFWNATVIASAHASFAGEPRSFASGLSQALRCLPSIFVWGAIAGTVGLFFQLINTIADNSDSVIGNLFALFLEAAWWMSTFFLLPILVLERKGVFESWSTGRDLFESSWGSHVQGGLGLELLSFSMALLSLPLGYIVYVFTSETTGAIVGFSFFGLVCLFGLTASAVMRTALYFFARRGELPTYYEKEGLHAQHLFS